MTGKATGGRHGARRPRDRPRQNRVEHVGREATGECVLLARVERAEECVGPRNDLRAVPEARQRARDRRAARLDRAKRRGPAERAERNDHPCVHQQGELPMEERRAPVALLGRGPVGRRRAPHGGGHVGATQPEAVARPGRGCLVREPDPVERGEQEIPGTVAREDAAGAIAAVRGRRQPDEHDPGRGVAPAWDGPRPVRLATEPRRRVLGRILAPRHEARARAAPGDLRGEHVEVVLHRPIVAKAGEPGTGTVEAR